MLGWEALFPNDFGLHLKCSHFEAELFRGGELGRQLCSRVWGGLERCKNPWVWVAYQKAMWCLGRSVICYYLFKSVLLFKNILKTLSLTPNSFLRTNANFLHNVLVSSVLDTSSGLLWPLQTCLLEGEPEVLVASFAFGNEPNPHKQKTPYLDHSSYFSLNLEGPWNRSAVTMSNHLKDLGDESVLEAGIEGRRESFWILSISVEGLGEVMLVARPLTPHVTLCLLRPEMTAGLDLASVYDAPGWPSASFLILNPEGFAWGSTPKNAPGSHGPGLKITGKWVEAGIQKTHDSQT